MQAPARRYHAAAAVFIVRHTLLAPPRRGVVGEHSHAALSRPARGVEAHVVPTRRAGQRLHHAVSAQDADAGEHHDGLRRQPIVIGVGPGQPEIALDLPQRIVGRHADLLFLPVLSNLGRAAPGATVPAFLPSVRNVS